MPDTLAHEDDARAMLLRARTNLAAGLAELEMVAWFAGRSDLPVQLHQEREELIAIVREVTRALDARKDR